MPNHLTERSAVSAARPAGILLPDRHSIIRRPLLGFQLADGTEQRAAS